MQIDVNKPFIIAEMSGNHNQSLERAMKIVEAAAETGVDAIKLQTYTADTMTIDKDTDEFFIADKDSLWQGESLYDLYKKAYTPWEWQEKIFRRAEELGLICFSTPFDDTAVDFLESINCPIYKIASFENTDLPLIRKVAKTGKPMLVSTGMASVAELDDMVRTARDSGCEDLTLMKCTSSYPATPEGANLRTIPHMKELFKCNVGLSDHTPGIGAAVASIALGATVIEKHFTLSRADGGVDSAFSLEPEEMRLLVRECNTAWQALGIISYDIQEQERNSRQFCRSLYIVEDIQQGEIITSHNMRRIRPGNGLAAKFYDLILGRKAKCDIKKGTPVRWELIE